MKTNKLIMSAMMALTLGGVMTSCNDFDDINNSPLTTGGDKIKPYYSLLSSIKGAQMDPYIGERLFVIEWAAAARQDGEDTTHLSVKQTMVGMVMPSDIFQTGCVMPTRVSISLRSRRAHGLLTRRISILT